MKVVLKGYYGPRVDDLESYNPTDPSCFGFTLQLLFGPEEEASEESFAVVICTPRWLEGEIEANGGVLMGRHYLLVNRFDSERIKKFLVNYAAGCTGDSWDEIAKKLGRLGLWEFEDYQPHPDE
jgi:hypothetical protein